MLLEWSINYPRLLNGLFVSSLLSRRVLSFFVFGQHFPYVRTLRNFHIHRLLQFFHTDCPYMLFIFELKFSTCRTYQISVTIFIKIYSSIGIFLVVFIFCLLIKHGEFHIFFYTMLFAVIVVIVRSIACISYRIFWIVFIQIFYENTNYSRTFGFIAAKETDFIPSS